VQFNESSHLQGVVLNDFADDLRSNGIAANYDFFAVVAETKKMGRPSDIDRQWKPIVEIN